MKKKALLALFLVAGMASMGAAVPQAYDGFEDGDYTSDPAWQMSSGSASVQQGTVKNGNYAMEIYQSGSEALFYHDRGTGTDISGDTFQLWMRIDGSNGNFNIGNDISFSPIGGFRFQGSDNLNIDTYDSSGNKIVNNKVLIGSSDWSLGSWYKLKYTPYPSNSTIYFEGFDSSGSKINSNSVSYSGVSSWRYVNLRSFDSRVYFDDVSYSTSLANNPPQFDSTSVTPDPFSIGDNLDVAASASDSDGSISSIGVEVFQDGTSVYSSSTSSSTLDKDNVYTAQGGTVKIEYTATDNDGATTTETISQTLSETAPNSPTINNPTGTFNDDSIEYDIATTSDGDDNPGESLTLTLKEDGTQVDQVTTTEGNSVTGSYTTSGEGSHNFDVTVEEPDGETSSASSTYSVDFISPTVDNLQVSPDPFDYQDKVDITVDASDNTEVSEVCVQVDKDGSNYVGQTCRLTNSATVSETFTDYFTVNQTNSDYTVNVQVTDNQGKTGSSSTTYTVSNDAPTSSATFTPNTWNYQDNIDVNYDFSDPNGNFDYGEIKTYKDNTLQNTYTVNQLSGKYTDALLIDETNSDYRIEVIAYDLQGATDTFTENQTVTNQDPSASANYYPSSWTFNDNVDIEYNYTDPNNNIDTRSIEVYKDNNLIESYSPTQNVGTVTDAFLVDETNATYEVQLSVTDLQGATGSSSTSQFVSNTAPSGTLNATPGTWFYQDQIDLSYDITDNEGDIQTREIRVFEAGTQIKTVSLNNNSGSLSNVFSTDLKDTEYQAQLFLEDSAGQTDSESITQTIADNAPNTNLVSPTNKTFWVYDVPVEVTVSDSDRVRSESYTCTLDKDGGQVDSFSLTEGGTQTFTGTVRTSLGLHTASVSCSDDAGNTGTNSSDYTVEDFKINTSEETASGEVYETTSQDFTGQVYQGDMIQSVDFELYWNGSQVNNQNLSKDGQGTLQETLTHAIPLVQNNQTVVDWNWNYSVERERLNGQVVTEEYTSTIRNQEILQAYVFNEHKLQDGFTQLEGSTLNYEASVNKLEASAAGTITGKTTFNQTGTTKALNKETGLVFNQSFTSKLINNTQETFSLSSVFTLSFNSDTRQFTNSKDVTLDKIILDKTTGQKTLSIETRDEVNNSLQDSNLEMGLTVNNPDTPSQTRFYGFDFNKANTHSINIQPSYAEVTVNAFQKNSIDYQNQDLNYPKRRHYLNNELLNNQTTEIDLYMLEQEEASNVEFELLDPDLEPLEQHVIRIERAFPSQEETRTVAMVKTGSEGKANTYVDPEEQYIFTVFDSEGNLKDQIGPQSITGLSTTLEIDPTIPPSLENLKNEVRFTDVQENNQSLVVDYISGTERLNNIYLTVRDDNLFDTYLIDSDKSSQPQGQLEVNGFSADNKSVYYKLTGEFGDTNITLDSGRYGTDSGSYGDAGMFMSLIFFLALSIAGLFRPSAAIGMGVIGVFVLSFIGFMPIGQTALISIAVLGAILVWRMS